MFAKEVKGIFKGHQIVARNYWGIAISLKGIATGTKLYVDGKLVDSNDETFVLPSVAIMRSQLVIDGNIHVIEIYASSVIRTRMKICVDGQKIAGDLK